MRRVLDVSHLPETAIDSHALLWWGTAWMAVIEGTMFAIVTANYLYLRVQQPQWPPPGVGLPHLGLPTAGLVFLLASVWPMHRSSVALEKRDRRGAALWLVVGLVLVAVFAVLRIVEWRGLPFEWSSHAYGSIVWAILVLHSSHVIAAGGEAPVILIVVCLGRVHDEERVGLLTSDLYWSFVVGSWVALYGLVYLLPRVL
jgi:heme/copper-type cytochrome/quinol oxidase subunit 3